MLETSQMEELRDAELVQVILPFKLPTWNQLLAMNRWERKKVRDWIHEKVFMCIQSGSVLRTPMGLAVRLSLTDLEKQVYLSMITPNSSKKYLSRKKFLKMRKR
jgi:hypothetical protein